MGSGLAAQIAPPLSTYPPANLTHGCPLTARQQLQRTVSHEPVRNHHRRRRADRRADRDLHRAHETLDANPRPRPIEPLDWQHRGL